MMSYVHAGQVLPLHQAIQVLRSENKCLRSCMHPVEHLSSDSNISPHVWLLTSELSYRVIMHCLCFVVCTAANCNHACNTDNVHRQWCCLALHWSMQCLSEVVKHMQSTNTVY